MYQESLPQLKLEVAAILLNYSEINESEELKRELKKSFKRDYSLEEIELALGELQELNEQVLIASQTEDIIIYPEQFYDGI